MNYRFNPAEINKRERIISVKYFFFLHEKVQGSVSLCYACDVSINNAPPLLRKIDDEK